VRADTLSAPSILVTGASGLLGRAIFAAFRSDAAAWRVCGTGFSRVREGLVALDLCDPAAVDACLESLRPRVTR
jgi:S-adenosylmethionine synthetase